MQHATPDLYSLQLPVDGTHLDGRLAVPARARGLVIFAHGSGSGMQSPRNGAVAADLRDAGLATLLFDLLDPAEQVRDARDRSLRFDIPLLGRRLGSVVDWAATHPATAMLSVGLYGASTGAAAALIAAADFPDRVAAVVSRGGRPDLAGAALRDVQAPT
ncbi:MAG: dienelactone hydrolase family protein, partial [Planctomycetota bacterium]